MATPQRFNILGHDFVFPSTISMIAKAGKGKTTAAAYFISKLFIAKYFKFGIVFSKTKHSGGNYDFMPKKWVCDGYDRQYLQDYLDKLMKYSSDSGQRPPPNFILFDDIIGAVQIQSDTTLQHLISSFRHYNMTLIFCVQYIKSAAMATLLRDNTQYAFIFNTKTENSLKGIHQSFGQLINRFEDFRTMLLQRTKEPYHFILYDETEEDPDDNYTEMVIPKFRQVRFSF